MCLNSNCYLPPSYARLRYYYYEGIIMLQTLLLIIVEASRHAPSATCAQARQAAHVQGLQILRLRCGLNYCNTLHTTPQVFGRSLPVIQHAVVLLVTFTFINVTNTVVRPTQSHLLAVRMQNV